MFDEKMSSYLRITGRADVAALAEGSADNLSADKEVSELPERYYDQVIEINLSELEPHLNGPGSPGALGFPWQEAFWV